jgi:hypothetical protein
VRDTRTHARRHNLADRPESQLFSLPKQSKKNPQKKKEKQIMQFSVTSPLVFLLGDLFPSERSNEKKSKTNYTHCTLLQGWE